MKKLCRCIPLISLPIVIGVISQVNAGSRSPRAVNVWDGSQFKFGLNVTTGNSKTTEINGALNLDYSNNHWANNLDVTGTFAKSNGVLNKQKYTARNEARYGFDPKRRHFLFLRGSWVDDDFSPYSYQTNFAAGYGRDLINTERTVVSIQIGPGYRIDKVRGSNENEERLIGTAQLFARVNIGKAGKFKQTIQYDSGPPFNYVHSVSAFNTRFSKHWATQIAFEAEYYSRIPPRSTNTEKLDTTTTVSIVYNF